jgi:hypothetical protein
MMKMNRLLVVAGVAACLCLGANELMAQGRQKGGGPPGGGQGGKGNFDPAQMRERLMERARELFDVKDDAEWKLIEERVLKVYEVQREATGSRFGGMSMLFGRGPGGGDTQGGGAQSRFGGSSTPNPDADALRKALEAKASNEQLKQKMEKVREARKASEAKLLDAQEALKELLNVRQEAVALQLGLVN